MIFIILENLFVYFLTFLIKSNRLYIFLISFPCSQKINKYEEKWSVMTAKVSSVCMDSDIT